MQVRRSILSLVAVTTISVGAALGVSPPLAGAATGPTVQVQPSTNVADGQVVTVTGAGFPPSASIAVVECQTGATNESGCDTSTAQFTTASSSGDFSTPYVASRYLHDGFGTTDCAVSGACALAAANEANTSENASTPLTFDPNAPPSRNGYWLVAADGGVFSFGSATFYGSMGGKPLNRPIVGVAATPDGKGYWLVASDGGVFTFGDAGFYGSMGGKALNRPIVGMAATPDGKGYWLVASDGGVFTFGDAGFYGSMGGTPLNKPVVGIASDPFTGGYWLVAADGGIFSFHAPYYGSVAPAPRPVVGMAPDISNPSVPPGGFSGLVNGYWFVDSSGGISSTGAIPVPGDMLGTSLSAPMVGMAQT